MPTDATSAFIYLLFIVPGLAFALSRERHRPRVRRSAFRETAAAVGASVLVVGFLLLLAAVVSLLWPGFRTLVTPLLDDPVDTFREHAEWLIVMAASLLAIAFLIAWTLGTRWAHRVVQGKGADIDQSSWGHVFTQHPQARKFAGLRLKSGDWLQGYVDTFGNAGDEGEPRALTLVGQLGQRPRGQKRVLDLDGSTVIIQSSEIEYMIVTHIEAPDSSVV